MRLVRKIGENILSINEGLKSDIIKYDTLKMDLFRANVIVTDGDGNFVGLLYFCVGESLAVPVVMG